MYICYFSLAPDVSLACGSFRPVLFGLVPDHNDSGGALDQDGRPGLAPAGAPPRLGL